MNRSERVWDGLDLVARQAAGFVRIGCIVGAETLLNLAKALEFAESRGGLVTPPAGSQHRVRAPGGGGPVRVAEQRKPDPPENDLPKTRLGSLGSRTASSLVIINDQSLSLSPGERACEACGSPASVLVSGPILCAECRHADDALRGEVSPC